MDLVWYWTYDKTQVVSIRILRQALHMLKTDPQFTFTQDQQLALQPFWDSLSADDRAFLLRMIKEGRFEVATGMYVQPDIAEPDFESLTREFLPAMPWMKETLGAHIDTAWNIDTYGQTVQMPQLFRRAGLKYFVFMRDVPETVADKVTSPFYWQSPDGSKILSYWLSGSYDVRWKGVAADLKQFLNHNVEGNGNIFVPWGGDLYFPNESTTEIEKMLRKAAEEDHIPVKAIVFSTPRAYFEVVEKSGAALPTYTYDFNPPLHIQDLRGLYGERPAVKLANRRAEESLESAEKFESVATIFGQTYPLEALDTAWENVLFNQDHDAVPGSHIDDVEDEMMSRYSGAIETGRASLATSLYNISRKVNTTGTGDYSFLVFNALSYPRNEVVRYTPLFKEKLTNFRILDEDGTPVPFRIIDASASQPASPLSMGVVSFAAKAIPAFGYHLYRIEPIAGTAHAPTWEPAKSEIVNQFYSVKIDPSNGLITSLKDRRSGHELLDTTKYLGNELVLEEEKDPNMEGMVHLTGKEVRATTEAPADSIVEIDDDLGTTLRSEGPFMGGRRRQEMTLYKDIPRIDFRTELLGFPGHDGMLAAVFPLQGGKKVTLDYETHNAVTRRPDGIFESQTWMDAGFDGYGLGIINKGTAGFHTESGVIRLTLLRSVLNFAEYYTPNASEAGSHVFEYSLYPHAGPWDSTELVAQAHSFNSPIRAIATDEHEGTLPASHSFMTVDGNFEVTAFKKAEKGDEFILRGHETMGKDSAVQLKFSLPVDKVWSADLLEQPMSPLDAQAGTVKLNCHPFEFVTIRLRIKQM
jgi:alpha-mannosidase